MPFKTLCHTMTKNLVCPTILFTNEEGRNRFIPFRKALVQNESKLSRLYFSSVYTYTCVCVCVCVCVAVNNWFAEISFERHNFGCDRFEFFFFREFNYNKISNNKPTKEKTFWQINEESKAKKKKKKKKRKKRKKRKE